MSEIEQAKFKLSILRHTINCENFTEYKMLFDDKKLSGILDLAIQALQEKLERENGCECCDFSSGDVGSAMSNVGDDFYIIKSDDGVSMATDGKHFSLLKINFCPMCGRRLSHAEPKHIGEATNMVEGE